LFIVANFSVIELYAVKHALRHSYWVFLTQSFKETKMLTFLETQVMLISGVCLVSLIRVAIDLDNLEYSMNSLNLQNLGHYHGILCNLRVKSYR